MRLLQHGCHNVALVRMVVNETNPPAEGPDATDRLPPIDRRIDTLVSGGARLGDAIRIALGGSVPRWVERQNRQRKRDGRPLMNRSVAANTIYSHRKPNDDVIAALVETLGGSPQEWAHRLWEAMRPNTQEPDTHHP